LGPYPRVHSQLQVDAVGQAVLHALNRALDEGHAAGVVFRADDGSACLKWLSIQDMTTVMTVVTLSNRKRPRAELREAILAAALSLIGERGYARTSVDEIVAAAGVAKGTFFNFFPSKLDVMKAYYEGIDLEVARERSRMNPASPLKALRDYADGVEAILLREGRLMLELLDLAMSDPAMRRIDEDSGAADADEFASFLVLVRDLGLIGPCVDPVKASAALVDLWAGAIRNWLPHPAPGSLSRLFGERIDLLFHGLGYSA